MKLKSAHYLNSTLTTGVKVGCSILALTVCLAAGSAQAADQGPRPHAQGYYDPATTTYVVAAGDDLFAISERFEIAADTLKADNKLASDQVKVGQKLAIVATGGNHTVPKATTHKAVAKKPLAKMTCEDFVALDESFQPKAVYWAVAYGKNGQPEAEEVEVTGIESVVPVVVEECKKTPKESFWQKVKAETKKIESKL